MYRMAASVTPRAHYLIDSARGALQMHCGSVSELRRVVNIVLVTIESGSSSLHIKELWSTERCEGLIKLSLEPLNKKELVALSRPTQPSDPPATGHAPLVRGP